MGICYGGMRNSDNETVLKYYSGFDQEVIDSIEMSKYVDKYIYGTTYKDEAAYSRRILGDATGETKSWYGGHSSFVRVEGPWFIRGGYHVESTSSSQFSFGTDAGQAQATHTFRIVVSKTS